MLKTESIFLPLVIMSFQFEKCSINSSFLSNYDFTIFIFVIYASINCLKGIMLYNEQLQGSLYFDLNTSTSFVNVTKATILNILLKSHDLSRLSDNFLMYLGIFSDFCFNFVFNLLFLDEVVCFNFGDCWDFLSYEYFFATYYFSISIFFPDFLSKSLDSDLTVGCLNTFDLFN